MKKLFKVCSLAAVLSCTMAFNAMACPIKISTFRPPLVPNPLSLGTFVLGGNINGFDPTGITFNSSNSHAIGMEGRGNAYGFDNTHSNRLFGISHNHTGNNANSSAPADVKSVPEPATLLLLGMGLVGVGTFSRKKSKI